MSIFSWLSTPTIAEKAVDAVVNTGDALVYTSEEKAKDGQLSTDQLIRLLEVTKDSSPARREIAMVVMLMWALTGINILVLVNVNIFLDVPLSLTELMDFAVHYVAIPTSAVLSFYFLKNMGVFKGLGKGKQ